VSVRTVPEASAKRILHRLREQEGAMTELLQRLALAESPSLEPRSHAPTLAILSEELESLDFAVRRVPGNDSGDHLEAEPRRERGGGPRQLLLGHLDTVWPLGTVEGMPVKLERGRLSGPGVYDMKGGLVQMLFALRALAELGIEPSVRAVVFINSDEEIGSPGSAEHISRLARTVVRAYVLEPSFGGAGKLKTARKGVGRFRLRIKGEASHAGLSPEKGVSAILEASHQIQRLFELNDPERGVTVNVGTIDGGLSPNVIAPEVVADVDVRALREEDARMVERAILALEPFQDGITIEVEGGFGRPPLEPTARNRTLWEAARRAADELEIPLEQATVGGASDGNITSAHTATLDGLGPVGEGAHASHEYVSVSQMPERAALLALLVMMPG
jgi:glutamate carboxypeptidase